MQTQDPQAALIFVHGLNEHVGRYQHVFDWFKQDFNLYFYEQRGHGRSEGARAFVGRFQDYVDDLKLFVDLVLEKEQTKKIFAIGHSMGGQVLLNYLAQNPKTPLAGFVTSSANIRIKVPIHPVERFLGERLAQFSPHMRIPAKVDPKYLSHDPAVVLAYKKDPLIPKYITVGLALEMLKNQKAILDLACQIQVPALMLHAGEDHLCATEGTVAFFERLASTDRALRVYEGFYHELFNELDQERVFRDMKDWFQRDKRA